jgi:ribosomal protein S14
MVHDNLQLKSEQRASDHPADSNPGKVVETRETAKSPWYRTVQRTHNSKDAKTSYPSKSNKQKGKQSERNSETGETRSVIQQLGI